MQISLGAVSQLGEATDCGRSFQSGTMQDALVEKGVRIHGVPAVAGIGSSTVLGQEPRMPQAGCGWPHE